jgi:hypothetical protein
MLLKVWSYCFRIKEENNWYPKKVQSREKEVGSGCQGREHDRVDKYGPSNTNGPAGDTEAITLSSHLRWEDLCWDEESNGPPSGRID